MKRITVMGASQGNGSDRDEKTPPPSPVGHEGNKEFLRIFGNFVLEGREHNRRLQSIYDSLRALTYPAPRVWGAEALKELDRHHAQETQNLDALREYVKE